MQEEFGQLPIKINFRNSRSGLEFLKNPHNKIRKMLCFIDKIKIFKNSPLPLNFWLEKYQISLIFSDIKNIFSYIRRE